MIDVSFRDGLGALPPKAHWARETLRSEVLTGRFANAELLPGERELAQLLSVSRTTLRAAIAALIAEGILYQRHGFGTYVQRTLTGERRSQTAGQPSRLTSFDEDFRREGKNASHRTLSCELYHRSSDEAMVLDLSPGDRVWRIVTLFLLDDASIAVEHASVNAAFMVTFHVEKGSFYAQLANQAFPPIRARQRVRTGPIGKIDAALMKVTTETIGICLQTLVYLADGRCCAFSRTTLLPDHFDMIATVSGNADV